MASGYTLITGASSGLGRAVALKLAAQKRNLIIIGRDPVRTQETAEEAKQFGIQVIYKAQDLIQIDTYREWLCSLISDGIDIRELYLCAAANVFSETLDLPSATWKKIYSANLLSVAATISEVLPSMVEKKRGKIVLISSVTAFAGFSYATAYAATKTGIVSLYHSLRTELKQHNIDVHITLPGAISTMLFKKSEYRIASEELVNNFLKKNFFYPISPEKAAERLVTAVDNNKHISYFPIYARPLCAITSRFPNIGSFISRKFVAEARNQKTVKLKKTPLDWNQKSVLLTGAASGIGKALTRELLQRNCTIFALDNDVPALARLKEIFPADNLVTFQADVTSPEGLKGVREQLQNEGHQIDILINNAGITKISETHELSFADWKKVLDVNLTGVVLGIRVFTSLLNQSEKGSHIVNISSLTAIGGYATAAPYSMSKGAVVGLTESLRTELEVENIHCSLVCPSYVRTAIFDKSVPNSLKAEKVEDTFLSHPVTSEIAAQAILKGVEKRKERIIFPASGKLLYHLVRWFPFLIPVLQKRILSSYYKAVKN